MEYYCNIKKSVTELSRHHYWCCNVPKIRFYIDKAKIKCVYYSNIKRIYYFSTEPLNFTKYNFNAISLNNST